MALSGTEHRFAVILCADVVGYSRLMGADEEGTLAALKCIRRDLVDPKITEHKGRIVRTMGDGLLAEFGSVVEAVRCAIGIQCAVPELAADLPVERQIRFRMAVNMGDVIDEGGSIFGDGVAVASRMESLAEPGGINVSRAIRDQVRDRLAIAFEDIGEHRVENLVRPVRIFRIGLKDANAEPQPAAKKTGASFERPSLIVLPFQKQGGDAEAEFFLDSLAEDLITELARARWFSVIARNTSFTYKGKSVDSKRIARDLGVRYMVEGSLRQAGNRARISCHLVEAVSGRHLWSERFDGTLEDSFDLQDRVVEAVIGSVSPALRAAEIELAKRASDSPRSSYELIMHALMPAFAETPQDNAEALRVLVQWLAIDPSDPGANGLAAWCRQQRHLMGWPGAEQHDRELAKRLSRTALTTGGDNPMALAAASAVRATLTRDHPLALAAADRALTLSPNSAVVLGLAALTLSICGFSGRAIEQAERAIRLSPSDPLIYPAAFAAAFSHLREDRPERATAQAERAIEANRNFAFSYCVRAMGLTRLSRLDEAAQTVQHLLAAAPTFRLASLRKIRFANVAKLGADLAGLRAAGLPD